MSKSIDHYKVLSCTGYTSKNTETGDKCPFYSDEDGYCSLKEKNIRDLDSGFDIPFDCDLRKVNILVSMKG